MKGAARKNNWDTWKGIAIIAVVAIHVTGSIKFFPEDSFNHEFGTALRQLLNFCVALFFAFSGYFSPDLTSSGQNCVKDYLLPRLLKIGLPYLAWTLIFLLIKSPAKLLSPLALGKAVLTGSGMEIGYFVVVLCCLIVIHPFTCQLRGKYSGWFVAWVPALLTLSFIYYLRIFHSDFPGAKFPYTALPFTLWFGFFHSGFLLKTNLLKNTAYQLVSGGTAALLIVAGIALSFLESHLLNKAGFGSLAGSQIRLSSFIYSFAVILAVICSPLGRISFTPISWLGKNSYSIYLSHLLILPPVQYVLKSIPTIWSNQVLYIPIATICIILFFTSVYIMLVPKVLIGDRTR